MTIDLGGSEPLQLEVVPLIADQELVEDAIIYWEGAVRIEVMPPVTVMRNSPVIFPRCRDVSSAKIGSALAIRIEEWV